MLVRLSSMTEAVRLKKRLSRENLQVQVVQNPAHHGKKGCSYGLEIDSEHLPQVKKAAADFGIQIMGIQT